MMNLSNSMITLHYELYLSPQTFEEIQREPFKVRQRVWSCIISLCVDGVSVAPSDEMGSPQPELSTSESIEWLCLANPSNFKAIMIRHQRVWWRAFNHSSEVSSIELCLAHDCPSSPPSTLHDLRVVNPLQYWVRNPEQASLRRAILTQQAKALCVSAPRGSGTTLAMASAVADWLEARPGECIFITRSERKVSSMIAALSDQSHRVHILSPATLTQILINSNDLTAEQMSSAHHLPELEEGGLLADSMSEREWDRWSTWGKNHRDQLGPWVESIGSLRRFILNRILVLGSPSQNVSLLSERLSDLPQNWRDGLVNLGQTLWESPLLETLRALEQLTAVHWPWPQARTLVIDDCLSLPWQLIYKTLKFADDHLGASGRRWTLMLASGGEGGLSSSGVTLDELETLVSGVLGWQIHRLKLSYSERLPYHKVLGLRRITEQWVTKRELPNGSISLPSALGLYRGALTAVAAEGQSPEPLWHIPSWGESDAELLKRCLQLCLSTPGAYILDLTARPQPTLTVDRSCAESIFGTLLGDTEITSEMLDTLQEKILCSPDLESLEIQWLLVYRGHSQSEQGSLIPEVLETIELIDFQSLLYLLSRSPTPLVWLGDLPVEISCDQITLSEGMERISQRSPWGGLALFERIERARAAHREGEIGESINLWRRSMCALIHLFGEEGHRFTSSELSSLYMKLISAQIIGRAWADLQAPLEQLLHICQPLSSAQDLGDFGQGRGSIINELKEIFSRVVSELSQEAESALQDRQIEVLVTTVHHLRELITLPTAHWYYGEVRESCWAWSERALSLPIPQAQVQGPILALLSGASPSSKEYQLLSYAYQHPPQPQRLMLLAEELFKFEPTEDSLAQARRAWTMKHLNRWIIYLLEPKSQTPSMSLRPTTIATGFALIAAQYEEWSSSEYLFKLSQDRGDLTSLDSMWTDRVEPQSEQEIEDEHRRRLWLNEWEQVYGQRDLQEQVSVMRESGDIEATIIWYEDQSQPLPSDVKGVRALVSALSELSPHWSSLKPKERAHLEMMWREMKADKEE